MQTHMLADKAQLEECFHPLPSLPPLPSLLPSSMHIHRTTAYKRWHYTAVCIYWGISVMGAFYSCCFTEFHLTVYMYVRRCMRDRVSRNSWACVPVLSIPSHSLTEHLHKARSHMFTCKTIHCTLHLCCYAGATSATPSPPSVAMHPSRYEQQQTRHAMAI